MLSQYESFYTFTTKNLCVTQGKNNQLLLKSVNELHTQCKTFMSKSSRILGE